VPWPRPRPGEELGVRIGFGSHGRVLREIEFGKEAFQYTPIHVRVRQNLGQNVPDHVPVNVCQPALGAVVVVRESTGLSVYHEPSPRDLVKDSFEAFAALGIEPGEMGNQVQGDRLSLPRPAVAGGVRAPAGFIPQRPVEGVSREADHPRLYCRFPLKSIAGVVDREGP